MEKRHWTPIISSWLITLSFGICGRFHAKFGCFCFIGYSYSVSTDWAWSNPSKVRFSEVSRQKESIEYQIQGMIPIQFKMDQQNKSTVNLKLIFYVEYRIRIHIASLGTPCLQSCVKQTDIVPTLFWIEHSPNVLYPNPKALNMATSNFDDWILRCLPNANWVILLVKCWSWMKNPFNHMNCCYKNIQEPFTKCLTFDQMIINEYIHLFFPFMNLILFIHVCNIFGYVKCYNTCYAVVSVTTHGSTGLVLVAPNCDGLKISLC